MNLFRSEEHARNWAGFSEDAAAGLLPLASILAIFSTPFVRERLNGRYVSIMADLRVDHLKNLAEITGGDPFWDPTPR